MKLHPYFPNHVLREGKLFVNGVHKFLKTGKPLRNFSDEDSVGQLISDLSIIREKGYDNLSLNCYWHHFNPSGNGTIEVSLDPLKSLVQAVRESGMYASLSVETYGVGGGQIPCRFWETFPEAVSINEAGEKVTDTEYGYNSAVPSIFHEGYKESSRLFMSNLVQQLGAANFLYFETTVEPQYMGCQWIDYGEFARRAYGDWCGHNRMDRAPRFPEGFPVPLEFRMDPRWNRFRAQKLADWVNGDARALRCGAANHDIWIAMDYLDAEESKQIPRCGNPKEFLQNLTEIDIIQVNWSWCNITREPNKKAYDRVREVMRENDRDWAISEHMTINGSDYQADEIKQLLVNTLHNGTCFGWEFVDVSADRDDPGIVPNTVRPGDFKPAHFAVYDEEWHPKPPMAIVEDNWLAWQSMVKRQCESTSKNPSR